MRLSEVNAARPEALDEVLSKAREDIFSTWASPPPTTLPRHLYAQVRYHNVKVFLKAGQGRGARRHVQDMAPSRPPSCGGHPERGLLLAARPAGRLHRGGPRGALHHRGPHLCDIALDRGCYAQMMSVAEATGSAFLIGYVRWWWTPSTCAPGAHPAHGEERRVFEGRSLRGGRGARERRAHRLHERAGNGMEELYAMTVLKEAAVAGYNSLSGGSSPSSRSCATTRWAAIWREPGSWLRRSAAGGLSGARETEFTNIRIIMMGRMSGLDADTIRERLRELMYKHRCHRRLGIGHGLQGPGTGHPPRHQR